MAIYLAPLILFGIQRESVTAQDTLGLCGNRIKVKSVTHEWVTFWGIRLGAGRETESKVDWLPDTDLTQLVKGATSLVVQILPLVLTGFVRIPLKTFG